VGEGDETSAALFLPSPGGGRSPRAARRVGVSARAARCESRLRGVHPTPSRRSRGAPTLPLQRRVKQIVLATRSAPEFCLVTARSQRVRPEVAGPMTGSATKQSGGAMRACFVDLRNETAQLDCFASLAMTTKEKRKRNADRRVHPTSAPYGRGARPAGRARLSAFHYGSYRQGFRPLGAAPGQASWDVAGRSILYGRSNRGAKTSRSYTGVTGARLSQSRECTSRTGRSAGQMMPKAARVRIVSFRARAPHSLHLSEGDYAGLDC